ncbi:Uncharacterised protein [Serratia quinivorans]|nr:Uncharacterised protein [Serratia quinivorans]
MVHSADASATSKPAYPLSGAMLDNPDTFRFSFKILDADQRLVC